MNRRRNSAEPHITRNEACEILKRTWGKLLEKVPLAALPVSADQKPFDFCGTYGCVYPSRRSGIVFKITSDDTEAAFVQAALDIGKLPSGIVRYKGIYWLDEKSAAGRNDIWILWREEAFDVGVVRRYASRPSLKRNEEDKHRISGHLIARTQAKALALQIPTEFSWWLESSERIWMNLPRLDLLKWRALNDMNKDSVLEQAANEIDGKSFHVLPQMESSRGRRRRNYDQFVHDLAIFKVAITRVASMRGNSFNETAKAMLFYLDHGIVISDVAERNLGLVRRMPRKWVITDAGLAILLAERWTKGVYIEEL